jgi:hypothetical protein
MVLKHHRENPSSKRKKKHRRVLGPPESLLRERGKWSSLPAVSVAMASSGNLCTFFARGNCRFGDKCRNIHEVSPSMKSVDHTAGSPVPGDDGNHHHSHPSHIRGGDDRSSNGPYGGGGGSHSSQTVCKFFVGSGCIKGDSCRFLHRESCLLCLN